MLANLINQHALADAQAGKWDAVAAILNASTVEVRNPKSWTMADLIGLVGEQSARVIGGTIKAAGAVDPLLDGAWMAINNTGLQLHTDERQKMIQELADAAGWPAELKSLALSAGLTYTSLAGEIVTAEQCQLAYEFARLAQQCSTLENESINPAKATGNRAAVIAAYKTAIETLEAG